MIKQFIAQNRGGGNLIENKITLTGSYSEDNLTVTFTLDYAYPGISNNYLAISIKGEGISYTPSPVMIGKNIKSNSYTFPASSGIPSQVYITSISPAKDSMYKYIAGDPWSQKQKTPIKLTASIQGTTMIKYYANQTVTSNLSFISYLAVFYANDEVKLITATGGMTKGTNSSSATFTPPSISGTYVSTVYIDSSKVSPTSDAAHTYSF